MENKGRKLGWIAIGIGVLALLVSVGGHFQSARANMANEAFIKQGYAQQVPFGSSPFAQRKSRLEQNGNNYQQQGPQSGYQQQGPQGGYQQRPQGGYQQQGPQGGYQQPVPFGPQGRFVRAARSHRPFFLMPLFFLFGIAGGLLRLALLGLLVFVIIRVIKQRRHQDPPANTTSTNPPTPPSQDPPYTGNTQSL